VGRTCVAVGAKLWLVQPLGFQVNDQQLRRAGMDYWQRLEWEVVDSWRHLSERLNLQRAWYYTKTARREYTAAQFACGDVLVFGCESQGLPPQMLAENADRALQIPIRSAVRSLNLSNSVAVAAYEAIRQISSAGNIPIDAERRSRND